LDFASAFATIEDGWYPRHFTFSLCKVLRAILHLFGILRGTATRWSCVSVTSVILSTVGHAPSKIVLYIYSVNENVTSERDSVIHSKSIIESVTGTNGTTKVDAGAT
jgi:hypothetical protein